MTNELTNSMEQSPSAASSYLVTQEIPRILWKTKFHYRVHKSPSVTQIGPVYARLQTRTPTVLFQMP